MPTVSVRIPQIGEGLQEARLVAVLKNPGDHVRRDEPIYQMETDKAVMDVESPYEGILVEWLAPVDTILPIGGEVARMEVAEGVEVSAPSNGAPTPSDSIQDAFVSAPVVDSPEPSAAEPAPEPAQTPAGANIVGVRIPQIGEGLQEARLVATLKNPGDSIRRDEPIYQMETDKAVMDVESPYEGILVEWLAAVDTVLPIGAEVARMKVEGAVEEAPAGHGAPVSAPQAAPPETATAARAGPAYRLWAGRGRRTLLPQASLLSDRGLARRGETDTQDAAGRSSGGLAAARPRWSRGTPAGRAVFEGRAFGPAPTSRRYYRFNLGQQKKLGEKAGGEFVDKTHFVVAGGQVKSMLSWLGYMKHGEPQERVAGLKMPLPNLKPDYEAQARTFVDDVADKVFGRPAAA